MAAAGLKRLWSGQTTQTFTAQGVSKSLQSAGILPYYASMAGAAIEIGVAAMPVAIIAKVGTTSVSLRSISSSYA